MDEALRAAAEALYARRYPNNDPEPGEAEHVCGDEARAAVAAFLREWEPSEAAMMAAYNAGNRVMWNGTLKAAARAEAERIEGGDG